MITTTRKIYTQKILESPYREVGGSPYKFVDGRKYEDTGELGEALDIMPIPNIKVWERDSAGNYTVTATYYNADATSSITASTKTIVWKGQDLTSAIEADTEIILQGTKFNDGKYTVVSAVFATNTTIVVSESMVADETVSNIEDGATLVTTATYYNVDDTSSIVGSTKTIVWKGQDLTATLEAGDVFWLDNTASNDGTYTVDTIVFGGGNTTIVVEEDTLVNETLDNADEAITFTTEVVYTNSDATSSIAANKGTLVIKGQDLTDYIANAEDVTLAGFTNATNNDTFTVKSINYGAPNTTIVIEDIMVTQAELGAITITNAGNTIVYTNTDATSSITEKFTTIVFKGQDLTDHIFNGDTITIANCDNAENNISVTVDSIAFGGGDSTIVVKAEKTLVAETLDGTDETISKAGETVVFTNSQATSNIVALTGVITLVGQDWTIYKDGVGLEAGDGVTIANCTNAGNNAAFTISTIDYDVTTPLATTITVVDPTGMADETLNGLDETFTVAAKTVVYENGDATSSITPTAATIVWKADDLTDYVVDGDTITLANCTNAANNASFDIRTITYGVPDTTIVLELDEVAPVTEVLNGTDETLTVTGKTVVYTNADPTSSLTYTDATIIFKAQDLTDYVSIGNTITLANCTNAANNDSFTVKTATLGGVDTTITVDETNTMVTETLNGTDETLTINGEEITYTNSDATSSATAATKTFVIKGQDLTTHILADDTFTIAGSESNDGTYTVATITYADSNTTIVVDETVVDETFDRNPELLVHDLN